ncbi:MAG: hypothetical protein HUU10_09390 [Bacteroidetes bacterium]|nr:hypothetical protein [Bacteroidota bacterium]
MPKDLIITSGNSRYDLLLRRFVWSLRHEGEFTGDIIICDNDVAGTWDQPGKASDQPSFTEDSTVFFKDLQVTVIPYVGLLQENDILRETIDQLPSATQRYPHKFVYTALISKRYPDYNRICYMDSDILIQAPVQALFDAMNGPGIFIGPENQPIGKNGYLSQWIRHTQFGGLSDQKQYEATMDGSLNLCTGLFGGTGRDFHRFCLLNLVLASNQFIRFYSDQPSVNILTSFFGYPLNLLNSGHVVHLGDIYAEDISVSNGQIMYQSTIPVAVHFNGGSRNWYDILFPDGGHVRSDFSHHWSLKGRMEKKLKRWLVLIYSKTILNFKRK